MNRCFNVSQDSGISQSPCNYQTPQPPPLPPKKSQSPPGSQPMMTNLNYHHQQPGSSWRVQQRHRVEVQRNSILSSDDEEDIILDEFRPRQAPTLSSVMMNEPFPAELDFAQVIGQSQFNASQPPPPPPRDPRRRLYLSPDSRPMSYSFENKPDVVQKTSHEPPPALIRVQHKLIKDQRQGRTASASSYFSHSVPDLVRPAEYWKSPPPPYVPTFDPYLQPTQQPPAPPRPPRPNLKKKLSDTSSRGRDSAIGPSPAMMMSNGKSSPSSSSVTSSRDSGYPVGHPAAASAAGQLLSAVDETTQVSATEEEISVIHCEESESETESYSPPRTNENHPGFSSKGRRSLFREAMNEIEDVFNQIQTDVDLLDRAERRDLPTAHQELIAQGRLQDECPTTSLNTSNEMLFSDMDNFMNWNTSSSFENIPEQRQRTPARRRSGKPDKIADDMVQRLCRDHNKLPGSEDPGVKLNQSYLLLSPALTPASSQAHIQTDPDEPDIYLDDMALRRRLESHHQSTDPEPPFGIPKLCLSRSSSKDYLHATPDLARYRSTFNAMKNPDTVLDDLAFRALRKDSNPSNPESLGIVKDPNRPVSAHSCWKHKMEAKLKNGNGQEDQAKQFPAVFYPKRNKILLQALSNDISQMAKRSSQTPDGGKEAKVITYEDLIHDPEVMESMKQSLGITDDPQEDTKEWSGKTLFQLLSNNNPTPPQKTENEIVVQSCILESRPVNLEHQHTLPFNNDEKKQQQQPGLTLLVEPQNSSVLRSQERLDSGSEDQVNEQCCHADQGNVQVWLLENPALLAACYCLALLHQLGGLDFMSLLGMILAMISMISVFFL